MRGRQERREKGLCCRLLKNRSAVNYGDLQNKYQSSKKSLGIWISYTMVAIKLKTFAKWELLAWVHNVCVCARAHVYETYMSGFICLLEFILKLKAANYSQPPCWLLRFPGVGLCFQRQLILAFSIYQDTAGCWSWEALRRSKLMIRWEWRLGEKGHPLQKGSPRPSGGSILSSELFCRKHLTWLAALHQWNNHAVT